MLEFIRKNKIVLMIVFAFSFIFWAQRLFVYTVGYDTAQFLYSPGTIYDEWLSKDRFMLVALKRLFPFILEGNLLRIKIITFVNSYIYTVLFMYFLELISNRGLELVEDKGSEKSEAGKKGLFKSDRVKILLAGMLFSASPMFMEHYYFTLQSAEISFAFIVILAIGVGLFYVVNKYVIWYFGIGRSGYVGNCWFDRPVKESLIIVYQAFAFTLRGLGPCYDLSWTIALIYLFLRIFRGRKTKGNGKRRSDKKKANSPMSTPTTATS